MRHVLKYLSLYERLCSGVIILCALSLGGIIIDLVGLEVSRLLATLSFVILLLAVIARLWLSGIGKKAIQRGVEVG